MWYREDEPVDVPLNKKVTVKMFPTRLRHLSRLRVLSKPLTSALGKIFASIEPESEAETIQTETGEQRRNVVRELSPEGAAAREAQLVKSGEDILDVLLDPDTQVAMGYLLMDSLRNEVEYQSVRPKSEVEKFIFGDGSEDNPGLEVPEYMRLVVGLIRANLATFGKGGDAVMGKLQGVASRFHLLDATPTPTPGKE
jgi:hypothetical protein